MACFGCCFFFDYPELDHLKLSSNPTFETAHELNSYLRSKVDQPIAKEKKIGSDYERKEDHL